MNKITFEKLNDGTCVITVLGMNELKQKFIRQETVKPSVYEALKLKIESK